MKKAKLIALTAIATVILSTMGCSRETVGPTERGKILSYSGYDKEIRPTGRYFLWSFWLGEKMIRLDTSINVADENIQQVSMRDGLMMDFNVQFRTRVDYSEEVINAILNDIEPDEYGRITWDMIYKIYGQRTVQQVARSVLSHYTVNEVLSNYEEVGKELHAAVTKEFHVNKSPLVVSNVTLGRPLPPKSIIDAKEIAARKIAEVTQIQADKEKDVAAAQASETIAREKSKAILIEAQTQADQQRIISQGLTPEYLQYLQIDALKEGISHGNSVYVPYNALQSPGVSNRIFNNSNTPATSVANTQK